MHTQTLLCKGCNACAELSKPHQAVPSTSQLGAPLLPRNAFLHCMMPLKKKVTVTGINMTGQASGPAGRGASGAVQTPATAPSARSIARERERRALRTSKVSLCIHC